MLRTTVAALIGLAASATIVSAEPIKYGTTVYTNNGRFGVHFKEPAAMPPSAADSHIIFMNKCTGGCVVANGTTDNRTDKSDIGHGTLAAFSQSAAVWSQVMTCMQATFSRFNVTVTDVDPGTAAHMEIMVAGLGANIGEPQGVLGVADFECQGIGNCSPYIANALVFDFANDSYYTAKPLEICATAAQEIAHTWALDHVVDATDPMTYNNYSGMRQYKDNQACGSDCQGGQSPFGQTCTGSGGNATHVCALGGATQNEVSIITALFGTSAPDTTPPVVKITAPSTNASVMPGFSITATVTDDQLVASAEAKLDGTSLGVKSSAPFSWVAPASLSMGAHHIEVVGTDGKGNTTSATVDVTYGSTCTQNSDCPDSTQVCDHSVCVAGPTATGGLGSPCTGNSDCASGSCGNDGTSQYCVSSCDPAASTCPSGF
ncbi:MAG TPA: Ig-like domain-containing protein, partial [Kofleriaceae bacterium]